MYVCVCIYMPLPRGFQNKTVFVLLTPVFNFSPITVFIAT